MSNAQRTFGQLSSRWTIVPWHHGEASGRLMEFKDRHLAFFWLRQFRSDPAALAGLRAMAAEHGPAGSPVARKHNDQVLEELSWLLHRGVLKVYRVPPPATAFQIEQASSPAETSYVPARSTPSQAAGPVAVVAQEADTFSSVTDGAATAAVLQSAAEAGTPFCEECAKAASSRMAA